MGRGRAKAKQTKVARRLKYTTPDMDLDALRQELSGSGHHYEGAEDSDFDDDSDEFEYDDDLYAKYLEDDDDEDDEDDEDVANTR